MRRAETRKVKIKRRKRLILLSLSVVMAACGLWFSSTNAYTLLKGYLMFETGQAEAVHSTEIKLSDPVEEKEQGLELKYPERPKKGENIGSLTIPKLEAKLPIYHGTDEEELEKGVGHFAKSVLPGEKDNSVLSGHRDTVFRRLGEVGKGDLLIAETSAGKFTYKVKKVRIVDSDDRTVIVPKPRAILTVSTCYPFDFIGASPQRYILVADLISTE
ncbi:class D sortase [Bacillus sp. UMB0893]|uniref:class D sortase n=1 Tax=Bacillus sp. UMB0893 TaxID=2066053 RepID=UPI00215323ED|nr:class D sortase [Bacillus sp. UMB0893]